MMKKYIVIMGLFFSSAMVFADDTSDKVIQLLLPKTAAGPVFVYQQVPNPIPKTAGQADYQQSVWKQVGYLAPGYSVFLDPSATAYKLAQAKMDTKNSNIVDQWIGLCQFDPKNLMSTKSVSCGNAKIIAAESPAPVDTITALSAYTVSFGDNAKNNEIGFTSQSYSNYLPVFYTTPEEKPYTQMITNWNQGVKDFTFTHIYGDPANPAVSKTTLKNQEFDRWSYQANTAVSSNLSVALWFLGPSSNSASFPAQFNMFFSPGEKITQESLGQLPIKYFSMINAAGNLNPALSSQIAIYPSQQSYCFLASAVNSPQTKPLKEALKSVYHYSPLQLIPNIPIVKNPGQGVICPGKQHFIVQWWQDSKKKYNPFGGLFAFATNQGDYLSWIDGLQGESYNLSVNNKPGKLTLNSQAKTSGNISYYQYYSPLLGLSSAGQYNQIGLTPSGSTASVKSKGKPLLNLTVAQGPIADFDYAIYHGKPGVTTLTVSVNNVLGVPNAAYSGYLCDAHDQCSASKNIASATSALTSGSLSFSFDNLSPSSTYYFAIQASRGNSKVLSNTQGPYTTKPPAPFIGASYSYTASNDSLTVNVKGVQSKGLSGASYTGYLCDTDKCSVTTADHNATAPLSNNALSFTFDSLSPEKPYYFFVQEQDGYQSAVSPVKGPYSTLTLKVEPPAKIKLHYIPTDRAKSSISWTPGSVSPSSSDVAVTYEINATGSGSLPISCKVSGVSTNSCVVGAQLLGGITYSVTIKMVVTVDGKPYPTKTVGPVNIES